MSAMPLTTTKTGKYNKIFHNDVPLEKDYSVTEAKMWPNRNPFLTMRPAHVRSNLMVLQLIEPKKEKLDFSSTITMMRVFFSKNKTLLTKIELYLH